MSIVVEIRPRVTEVFITNPSTEVTINASVPNLKWGNLQGDIANQTDLNTELTSKIDKTAEIQALEAVSALPGTPDPNTIYFITTV